MHRLPISILIIFGGFSKDCRCLQIKAGKISPQVLDIKYADMEALFGSLAEIIKSLVFTNIEKDLLAV
jgi:hypothetical protein